MCSLICCQHIHPDRAAGWQQLFVELPRREACSRSRSLPSSRRYWPTETSARRWLPAPLLLSAPLHQSLCNVHLSCHYIRPQPSEGQAGSARTGRNRSRSWLWHDMPTDSHSHRTWKCVFVQTWELRGHRCRPGEEGSSSERQQAQSHECRITQSVNTNPGEKRPTGTCLSFKQKQTFTGTPVLSGFNESVLYLLVLEEVPQHYDVWRELADHHSHLHGRVGLGCKVNLAWRLKCRQCYIQHLIGPLDTDQCHLYQRCSFTLKQEPERVKQKETLLEFEQDLLWRKLTTRESGKRTNCFYRTKDVFVHILEMMPAVLLY